MHGDPFLLQYVAASPLPKDYTSVCPQFEILRSLNPRGPKSLRPRLKTTNHDSLMWSNKNNFKTLAFSETADLVATLLVGNFYLTRMAS